MLEISMASLEREYEEATIQSWFIEEGDVVEAGDDLVELLTEDGVVTLQAPISGILSEVYFDEGEVVANEELLCLIDDESM